MGASQSGGVEIGGSSMGYQVLRVYPNSPGSRAGLKAYFDFIIAIGNTRFNKENGSLREILKASVDQKLKMVVYNTRTKKVREVEIIPSTSWGGNGLLGVSIKHSSFDRADERVWHVVEVEPGSPAHQAGFKSNEDYVIGSDSILQENDDLYNLVEAHEGKALKLFVYNINNDNCREVICHPNSRWGGKGYLGCEFGHGLLHRIPYGEDSDMSDNPRALLLRNEQPVANLEMQQNNNMLSFQNQLMQQQIQQLQRPTQPGQQLFQQALCRKPFQPPQQQVIEEVLQPTPQLPQTFAQLANAQYQTPQYHVPQQQSIQHQAAQYQPLQQQNIQHQPPQQQTVEYQSPRQQNIQHQSLQHQTDEYQPPQMQNVQHQLPQNQNIQHQPAQQQAAEYQPPQMQNVQHQLPQHQNIQHQPAQHQAAEYQPPQMQNVQHQLPQYQNIQHQPPQLQAAEYQTSQQQNIQHQLPQQHAAEYQTSQQKDIQHQPPQHSFV